MRNRESVLMVLLAFHLISESWAFAWDYGNGRHGSFVLTTNATIEQLYQTVHLTNDPAQYNPSDSNAIPNFQNLTIISNATLMASAWNGTSGGLVTLKVQGTLSIASGSAISVSGQGYRGGAGGRAGESYAGNQTTGSFPNFGGGGGGFVTGGTQVEWHPGGGAGYGSPGQTGANGGGGGNIYGSPVLETNYLGSGGGGGVAEVGNSPQGGNGGGAILIYAGRIELAGLIQANGTDPSINTTGYHWAAGGCGSGGSIKLQAAAASLGINQVTASGGTNGVIGGDGRIAVYYAESFSGTTLPSAYASQDTNSDNVTIITNQPIAQISFLGSNAMFSVAATGFPPLFYQWNFNGTPISEATNETLPLASLDFTNQGNYSVSISNFVDVVVSSNAYLTVLDPRDPFGDGIPNWWKTQYGLSLTDPTLGTNYPPGDRLTYQEKYLYGLNPLTNDTDGDGLTDYSEIFTNHTNPTNAFTTGDGIPDGWKVQYGLNPLVANANSEIGSSGVTYWQIYQFQLVHTNQLNEANPAKPFFAPGTSIYETVNNGQHTNRFYYDREDRLLGAEYSRGISIAYLYDGNGNLTNQAVLSRAVETNGLPTLWRYLNGITNNNAFIDSDSDGWSDYQEWLAGTDPRNAQSTPNLLGNPGTNIASLTLPFTPSNFVVGTGNLVGFPGDEIVVGADGNPGTNANFLLVMTQAPGGWSSQELSVGKFGITSIAVGQLTNRPGPAIYVGLRGITNGSGRVMEFANSGGVWSSNIVTQSESSTAFVLGVVNSNAVMASLASNSVDGVLVSATFSTNWVTSLVDTNTSHRGLGTIGNFANLQSDLRLLDSGGMELGHSPPPTNAVYRAAVNKWYFTTPTQMTWSNALTYAQQMGDSLVSIADDSENSFVRSLAPTGELWIGLYRNPNTDKNNPASWLWQDGSASTYRNWATGEPTDSGGPNHELWVEQNPDGRWNDDNNDSEIVFAVVEAAQFLSIIAEPTNQNPILSPQCLTSGSTRPTNATSIFYSFGEDKNANGTLDAGDDFATTEYVVSGTNATLISTTHVPIASPMVAQSYGSAVVSYLNSSNGILFTGEPDGQVFAWTATDATNPLQRQLFSPSYYGKAWQALTGVKTASSASGLAGLMVDPANPKMCNVIFWPPQTSLPQLPNIAETAPYTAVLPSTNPLGSNSVITVRLWDNEGNPSAPFLQWQILGSTTWQDATITMLDGAPYGAGSRVTALPTGFDHSVIWDASADIGDSIVTNIFLRSRAQDFMLVGDWSQPTPFQLNTSLFTNPNPSNPPVIFAGVGFVPGGFAFNWQGVSNSTFYIQRSPALTGTNAVWIDIYTGLPPTSISGSYTDLFSTNQMEFYRMKIGAP